MDHGNAVRVGACLLFTQGPAQSEQQGIDTAIVRSPAVGDPKAIRLIFIDGGIGEDRWEICAQGRSRGQGNVAALNHNIFHPEGTGNVQTGKAFLVPKICEDQATASEVGTRKAAIIVRPFLEIAAPQEVWHSG